MFNGLGRGDGFHQLRTGYLRVIDESDENNFVSTKRFVFIEISRARATCLLARISIRAFTTTASISICILPSESLIYSAKNVKHSKQKRTCKQRV